MLVCRSGFRPNEEVQADRFASYLLMPRSEILDAWARWRGSHAQASFADVMSETGLGDLDAAVRKFVRPLADEIGVSAQALDIRLRNLDLIVSQPQHSLFG